MSADQIVLLALGLIVIAAVAVTVAWATAYTARRDPATGSPEPATSALRDHGDGVPDLPRSTAPRGSRTFIAPTSTRQVARAVALLYLASAAVIVAITGAWPDTQAAVFTLLALGTLLVVLFMDLVPPATLGRWRRPAEGIGAVIFLALLTALSGGASSPFFVGFFLVVAGTALSTEGRAPLAIALLAAASVVLVGVLDALDAPLAPEALAWVGFTAVALILLADIATAAARAQRHARDEALRASRFDSLTGLYNRAFFFTTMEQEIRRSDRMGRDFTMLMLDLDDLKPVNDTLRPPVGRPTPEVRGGHHPPHHPLHGRCGALRRRRVRRAAAGDRRCRRLRGGREAAPGRRRADPAGCRPHRAIVRLGGARDLPA